MGYEVLRRRVAAMYPREKRFLPLVSAVLLGLVAAVLGLCFPAALCLSVIVAVCAVLFYRHKGNSGYPKPGLNPRRALRVPPALRRWFSGRSGGGGPLYAPGGLRQADGKYPYLYPRQRPAEAHLYRGDALASETFLFSPRDILMGSYIAKEGHAERPGAGPGPGAHPNPRELLRERLTRPNHAVHTPNRRLSFTR